MPEEIDDKTGKKYKLGLVLSGGGAKAFAHLGVIKAMGECGLRPDIISGTSAGAIAGAMVADGYRPQEIVRLFHKLTFLDFTDIAVPHAGISKTTKLENFLKTHLRAKNFEDLRVPLCVGASDFDRGETRYFTSGPLIPPILAACSIPLVYNPTVIDGVNYVDGGLLRNLPAEPLRGVCETLIGVNIMPMEERSGSRTLKSMAERTLMVIISANSHADKALCDIVIEPAELVHYSLYDVHHSDKIYKIGYDAAVKIFAKKIAE